MYNIKIQLEGPIVSKKFDSLKNKPINLKFIDGGKSALLTYDENNFSFMKEIFEIPSKYIQFFKSDVFIFEIEICLNKYILSSFYKNKNKWTFHKSNDFTQKDNCVDEISKDIKLFEKRLLLESFK